MKQSKRLVSLTVVLAMIITMFASFTVANAAGAGAYVEATKTDDGVQLVIGYKGLETLEGFEIAVPIPDAFTVTNEDITYSLSGFADANYDAADKTIYVTAAGAEYPADLVIATVNAKLNAEPTVTTTYDFSVSAFQGTKVSDSTDISIADNTVENITDNAKVTYEVETVVTGPRAYIESKTNDDGTVTLTVGYKEFAEALDGFEFTVPVPAGYEVKNPATDIALNSAMGGFSDANLNGTDVIATGAGGTYPAGDFVLATITLTKTTATVDVPAAFSAFQATYTESGTDVSIAAGNIAAENTTVKIGGAAETVTIAIDPTTATVKAGESYDFTVTVTGSENGFDVNTTAAYAVDGSKVTVTVPTDAAADSTITVTVTAKDDATATATATITVAAEADDSSYEAKGVAKNVKINGKQVATFIPQITVKDATAFAAAFADATTYRIVFDFVTADGTTVGYAVVPATGAQIKAMADSTSVDYTATAIGAEKANVHIETLEGDIVK